MAFTAYRPCVSDGVLFGSKSSMLFIGSQMCKIGVKNATAPNRRLESWQALNEMLGPVMLPAGFDTTQKATLVVLTRQTNKKGLLITQFLFP